MQSRELEENPFAWATRAHIGMVVVFGEQFVAYETATDGTIVSHRAVTRPVAGIVTAVEPDAVVTLTLFLPTGEQRCVTGVAFAVVLTPGRWSPPGA